MAQTKVNPVQIQKRNDQDIRRSSPSWFLQVAVVAAVGPLFGLSRVQSVRAGLLLAAGGEFAFVALCARCSHSWALACMGLQNT